MGSVREHLLRQVSDLGNSKGTGRYAQSTCFMPELSIQAGQNLVNRHCRVLEGLEEELGDTCLLSAALLGS